MLPEDRYVNTFAFASDAATSDVAQQAAIDRVKDFYYGVHAGGTIGGYMSGRTINEDASEFRAYAMEEPPTRIPYIEVNTEGALGTSAPLPSEVAICGSYYAVANQPRKRGRVYIGPLGVAAMAAVETDTPGRVSLDLRNTIVAAMSALGEDIIDQPRWCILTLPDAGNVKILRPVTHVWCDNAFDTQRRRGETATSRLLVEVDVS